MACPSNCVKESYPYLIVLCDSANNIPLRKLILQNKKVIDALSEVALNLVKGNIPLSNPDKRKLKKYKKELIQLIQKQNRRTKYNILTGQRGSGLLSGLLSVALPVLSSLLASTKRHGTKY